MSRCHGRILSGSQQLNRGPTNMTEKKKRKKIGMYYFPGMIALRNKTVALTFLPSFENANGRLCQEPEILLTWSRDDLLFSISPLS